MAFPGPQTQAQTWKDLINEAIGGGCQPVFCRTGAEDLGSDASLHRMGSQAPVGLQSDGLAVGAVDCELVALEAGHEAELLLKEDVAPRAVGFAVREEPGQGQGCQGYRYRRLELVACIWWGLLWGMV